MAGPAQDGNATNVVFTGTIDVHHVSHPPHGARPAVKLWGLLPGTVASMQAMTLTLPGSNDFLQHGTLSSDIFGLPASRNLRLASISQEQNGVWTTVVAFDKQEQRPAPSPPPPVFNFNSSAKAVVSPAVAAPSGYQITGINVSKLVRAKGSMLCVIFTPTASESPILKNIPCDGYSRNDVVFVFPNSKHRSPYLWANIGDLSAVSPYWQTMFTSGYSASSSELANVGAWQERWQQDLAKIVEESRGEITTQQSPSPAELTAPDASRPDDKIRWVVIKDTAYHTYRSVLIWITHGKITFSPLLLNFSQRQPSEELPTATDIYKLAHQLSISALMTLALEHYTSELNQSNCLFRLFSSNSYLYPDLRKAALEFVVQNKAILKGPGGISILRSTIAGGGSDSQVIGEIVAELMQRI